MTNGTSVSARKTFLPGDERFFDVFLFLF